MYVCVCVPTTESCLRKRIRSFVEDECSKQADYDSLHNLRKLKKEMGICQVCCKCNKDIKGIWYDEINDLEN